MSNRYLQLFFILSLLLYAVLSNAQNMITKAQVPVLCYHQVRDWKSTDSKKDKVYITPVDVFKKHMKVLHDSGFHTILPYQLVSYYLRNEPLPSKPIMITFDDGTASQYENALPELNKNGFKAVFFIMTIAINKPKFMSDGQIKALSDQGHVIGCHTWDHKMMTKYDNTDWEKELKKSTALLAKIIDNPIKDFAYPNGVWNEKAIEELKNYGFITAFQLSTKQDNREPLFTIRRIIVDGNWSNSLQLLHAIKVAFKNPLIQIKK